MQVLIFDGSKIRETLRCDQTPRELVGPSRQYLQDATCGKALKAELEGYWSLQVGRTRIIYRLTTGTIEIVTIGLPSKRL